MSVIRIPTPLRAYTDGLREVEVGQGTVAEALEQLSAQYPGVRPHLFSEEGQLRPYVNLFLNDEDVRGLQGDQTELKDQDRLMIVPSIAGGAGAAELRAVDHAALQTNQGSIIFFLLVAFIADLPWAVFAVGLVMLAGTLIGRPGFLPLYRALRSLRIVQPDVLPDNPEPHRFSQGLGGVVLMLATLSLSAGAIVVGWALTWVVIALAGLNLFGGFCVGCALYYWLSRAGVPGFKQSPPPGVLPGRRPPAAG